MLRLPAIATVVLVVMGLLTVPMVTRPPAATAAPAISWGSCSDPELDYLGLQCGRLAVPRDHSDPTGPTISLALTRRPHTSSTFRGALLVNPGGPGGSGLAMPSLADYVPGNVGASYDWIGFDPRGVGASSPSLRCSRNYFTFDRPNYVPTRPALYQTWLKRSRAYAAACADTAAKRALLPHLTTRDTVRDMDLIRDAVGASKLNFYGFSYGTYLGQVYATLYPARVGRFVLDGVVNPRRVWAAANFDQDRAFDRNMDVFFAYLAKHPKTFKLGKRWRAIKKGYYRQLKALDRRPAAGGRLGPDELADVMLDAGYYVYNWVDLGLAYSALTRKRRGAAIAGLYRQNYMGDDNGFAVYNAVQCTDVAWPSWPQMRKRTWAVHRDAPFLAWGNTWYNAPCLSWRAPAQRRTAVSGRAVTAKILMISETRDAATPYSGALAARRLFPTASLVAGMGGTTHSSSLSGVPCVDTAVASYLRSGVVPRRVPGARADRKCPALRAPVPGDVWGRTTTASPADRMSPLLREALTRAQRHQAG